MADDRQLGDLPADITPNVLRHSFATLAPDLGFNEPTIASLFGHKTHSITSRYVRSADAVLLAAADAVADVGYGRSCTAWSVVAQALARRPGAIQADIAQDRKSSPLNLLNTGQPGRAGRDCCRSQGWLAADTGHRGGFRQRIVCATFGSMALHPDFPRSPYEILRPDVRWFPAAEELRHKAYEKLLPPLVANIRAAVRDWRNAGYRGTSATSLALLTWWFTTEHLVEAADGTQSQFLYYFAQREAVETVIWLYDVRGVSHKFDLLRFDASGAVSANMFDENWPRFVLKMAGAGKTKVLSLLIAWCYFHKLYEPDSTLARNFLLIAPNIIVLDRLRADFDGLRIFFNDPVLPDNGHGGQNWRDDFQIAFYIQDNVRIVRPTGNIFLTNIHRVDLSTARAVTRRRRPTRLFPCAVWTKTRGQDNRQ